MLPALLLAAGLQAQEPPPAAPPAAPPAVAPAAPAASLSFASAKAPFAWDKDLPLALEVDGLKATAIFFNRRAAKARLFQGPTFGTRAQVKVTNTALKPRTPGFAVAVFDAEGQLLGAANGGTKFGTVKPGETETFDLNFFQVKERLPKGATFVLSIELRN
jgi:hypothetical protein